MQTSKSSRHRDFIFVPNLLQNKIPISEIVCKMTNLKNDLDEYLLLQSDQKKSFKIDMKMPTIKVPEIKSFFGRSEPEEANSWLQDTQESCCPKLVRIFRHDCDSVIGDYVYHCIC